jgi:hypothetical protein
VASGAGPVGALIDATQGRLRLLQLRLRSRPQSASHARQIEGVAAGRSVVLAAGVREFEGKPRDVVDLRAPPQFQQGAVDVERAIGTSGIGGSGCQVHGFPFLIARFA